MRKLWLLAAALVAGATPGLAQRNARLIARIDSLARETLARDSVPGLSLAVARGREMIIAKGYGYARLDDSTPATDRTVYPIASLTKQVTAAAVLRLFEDKQLRLDDPITAYFPEYARAEPPITIRHLLNHTSGLSPYAPLDFVGAVDDSASVADVVDFYRDRPAAAAPGERFAYSNAGYYLVGRIVEQASHRAYLDFVRERFFTPAGMGNTGPCTPREPEAAWGYERDPDTGSPRPTDAAETPPGPAYAAAGLCSTVLDLIAWQRAVSEHRVINRLSWQQMIQPAELKDGSRASYGFGIFLGRLDGHRMVGHGGAAPGFSAQLSSYPDDELTVVVLANGAGALTRLLADRIARRVLGLVEPTVKDVAIAVEQLAPYEGGYDLQGTVLQVYVEHGRLRVQLGDGDELALLYQGSHEFAAEADPSLRFIFRVSRGRARNVWFKAGSLDATADRLDVAVP